MATSKNGCRSPRNSGLKTSTRHKTCPSPSLTHISWRELRRTVSPSPNRMLNRRRATSTLPASAAWRNDATGCTASSASSSDCCLRFLNHTASSPSLSRDAWPATVTTSLPCPTPGHDRAVLSDAEQRHDTRGIYISKNSGSTSGIASSHHSAIPESLLWNRPSLSRMSPDNFMGNVLNIRLLHPPC